MVELLLDGLPEHIQEATVQNWFFEEGDGVNDGDEIVELSTDDGTFTIAAPTAGLLAEVYYDEGEVVTKGEVLCAIDDEVDDD